jgi:hypothetical protein
VEDWETKRIFATYDLTWHPRTYPYWEGATAPLAKPTFEEHAPYREARVEGNDAGEVRRSRREWQPSEQALRNVPDVGAAPGGADPRNERELRKSAFQEEWLESDLRELSSHAEHETWRLISREDALATGARIFKSKMLRKTKLHPDGTLDKRKSRLIIMAFTKALVEGVDYEEKYAGTARFGSVLGVLAYAAHHKLLLLVIDIVTFFLYGKLGRNDRLLMEQPAGHEEPGKEGWVCELLASIYGCPQAANRAKKELTDTLVSGGFVQFKSDDCVFKLQSGEDFVVMTTHVESMTCSSRARGGER